MLRGHLLSLLLLAPLLPGTEDGAAWIAKAEARLYRWPQDGGVVPFEAVTDALAEPIAAMRRDIAQRPDPEATKLVDALEHASVHGTVDTRTGSIAVEVTIAYQSAEPRTSAAVDRMKSVLTGVVRGALVGLPLQDPSLVPKGSTVGETVLDGRNVRITVRGARAGDDRTLTIDTQTELPVSMTVNGVLMSYRYTAATSGTFVPARLDLQPKSGPASRADYAWQRVGGVFFPASVRITQGTHASTVTFRAGHPSPAGD